MNYHYSYEMYRNAYVQKLHFHKYIDSLMLEILMSLNISLGFRFNKDKT
jgi:hypothetical protein